MSRLLWLSVLICSSASAERLPCLQAWLLPFAAPLLVPPCILHRFLPLTAGERHGWPALVLAPQRGALAKISGCMGLSVLFEKGRARAPEPSHLKFNSIGSAALENRNIRNIRNKTVWEQFSGPEARGLLRMRRMLRITHNRVRTGTKHRGTSCVHNHEG